MREKSQRRTGERETPGIRGETVFSSLLMPTRRIRMGLRQAARDPAYIVKIPVENRRSRPNRGSNRVRWAFQVKLTWSEPGRDLVPRRGNGPSGTGADNGAANTDKRVLQNVRQSDQSDRPIGEKKRKRKRRLQGL